MTRTEHDPSAGLNMVKQQPAIHYPLCQRIGCPHRCKRHDLKFCSRACSFQSQVKPRSLCKAGCGTIVQDRKNQYCSHACAHQTRKTVRALCPCGCKRRLVRRQQKYFSKRCAWLARRGWEAAAKGRVKAIAVNRQKYVARLREKLLALKTPVAIWRAAYAAGFNACNQGYLRKIRRGDITVNRERRVQPESWAS